jgi:hypothetical protein
MKIETLPDSWLDKSWSLDQRLSAIDKVYWTLYKQYHKDVYDRQQAIGLVNSCPHLDTQEILTLLLKWKNNDPGTCNKITSWVQTGLIEFYARKIKK